MRFNLLSLLVLCSLFVQAQDYTRSFGQRMATGNETRITVVPFEPRMIISDLHRDMCVKNQMNSRQVREAIAGGFCYAMRETAPEMTEAEVFGWDDPWPESLERLYKELGYKNTAIYRSQDPAAEPKEGAYLEEGELRYRYDTLTRYMRPVIPEHQIAALSEETGTDYVLVVSQIDIVNLGELVRVNPGNTDFYVRLHYCLFAPDGALLDGGLVSHALETRTYDPTDLAKNEFKNVARQLYKALARAMRSEEGPYRIEADVKTLRTD